MTTAAPIEIRRIDLTDPAHVRGLLAQLDAYAAGPTGSGRALAPQVHAALPGLLAAQPHYLGLLAFAGAQAVGVANCFLGVSTFRAQPLLNLHDIAVDPGWQRRGVGRALLARIEQEARARGCCKITLEVLEGNAPAIAAYRQAGFGRYALDPAMGGALFFEKPLA